MTLNSKGLQIGSRILIAAVNLVQLQGQEKSEKDGETTGSGFGGTALPGRQISGFNNFCGGYLGGGGFDVGNVVFGQEIGVNRIRTGLSRAAVGNGCSVS